MVACAPSRPSYVLDPDEVEDILYDMHVAQSMYDQRVENFNDEDIISLRASVLKNHDISQSEWDSTFSYYCRNSQELYAIYQSLTERINGNVVALGGRIDGLQDSEADTANVWNREAAFLLMQQAPYNRLTFEIIPDSTFEDGDRITLQYDAQMIFQDGYRDVVSFLAVYYDNDSIVTNVIHTTSDNHGINIINNDVDRLHIKRIKGYFILNGNLVHTSSNPNGTTMRLAAIRNVKLLHTRTQPPAPAKTELEANTDSLTLDSLRRDSIQKAQGGRFESTTPKFVSN